MNEKFFNLFLGFKPIWLRKILLNLLGFCIIYPILIYNRESAFLLSLFFSVFVYRNLKEYQQSHDFSSKCEDFAINQFIASLFCACLIIATPYIFICQILIACVFLRIYDIYKPSLIGRFAHFTNNLAFGYIISAMLNGLLSGASVMIPYSLLQRFGFL